MTLSVTNAAYPATSPRGSLPLKANHPTSAQLCPLETCVKLSVSAWVLPLGPKRIPSMWQPLRSLETLTTPQVLPPQVFPSSLVCWNVLTFCQCTMPLVIPVLPVASTQVNGSFSPLPPQNQSLLLLCTFHSCCPSAHAPSSKQDGTHLLCQALLRFPTQGL